MKEKSMKIEYSDSFISRAVDILKQMVATDRKTAPYGPPFNNFSVVIGETDKSIVAIIDVPEDIKEKIGDKKVYLVTE